MGDHSAELRKLRDELHSKLYELKQGYFKNVRAMPVSEKVDMRRELRGHFQKVYCIHWAGRGSDLLVSASQDGKMIVWNAHSTNKLNAIPLKSPWVMSCAFEQTHNQLVASGGLDNICTVYRLSEAEYNPQQQPEVELEAHLGYISCCRFMDENRLVTSSGDSTCRLWDTRSGGKCLYYFKEHVGDVMSVAPHPENTNIFISGSVDLECKLWDIRTQNAVGTFQAQPSPRTRRYYVTGFEEEEAEGTQVRSSMFYTGHDSDVNSVAFFPDGFAFGTGSDDATCRLWDLRCHQEVNSFKHHIVLCGITSVEFSKSGRLLFAGYDDHTLHGWDVLKTPEGDAGESEPALAWKDHSLRVSSVSVHSDGLALATASWDTTIRIYA